MADEKQPDISELFDKCSVKNPTPADVKALKKALTVVSPERMARIEDLAGSNISAMLKDQKYSVATSELTRYDLERKRDGMGYQTAPMMERMLIDAVLLAWLRYQEFEYVYTALDRAGMSFQKAAFWDRRISVAQARYLKACETLAKVRKLTSPVLQVNIAQDGGQQVNVAGDFVKA
jgi:hypothetical protein